MANDNGGGFFTGLILGGLIGAGLALLFAPQPGSETQQMLREKGIELRERAAEFDPDQAAKSVRQTVREAIEEGKQAASRTKEDMMGRTEPKLPPA